MTKGIFGGMFDFNQDGELDVFERAAEFSFLNDVLENEDDFDSEEGGEDDE